MLTGIGETLAASGVRTPEESAGRLGQEQFLKLMITQLENQDPFKPLENGEFLGQLAQFGTVSGIADLERSFADLSSALVSSQALQAAGLVGRSVLVQSEDIALTDGPAHGAVELESASSSVRIQILDSSVALVRQLELGPQPEGLVRFSWAGDTEDGEAAEPGLYTVSAQYHDGTEMRSAATMVEADVDSVTIDQGGLSLQLQGLGARPFGDVREIG